MKNLIVLVGLLFTLVLLPNNTEAKDMLIFSGGYNRNSFLGEGEAGNTFDYGHGYNFEFGFKDENFCWIIYGISGSTSDNHVKSSVAEATFFTPYYTEFRFYTFYGLLFYFFGFDLNQMKFENTEGSDLQYFWSLGLGGHIQMGSWFLQPKLKPYLVTSNTLDQDWGIQMQLNLGFSLGGED